MPGFGSRVFLVSIALLIPTSGPSARVAPADLVLRNGKIVTLDAARPGASALAARGDSIVAVGTDREIASYVGPATRVIDLAGRLAIPGLIEGHGHFTGIGQSKMRLKLSGARSWDEIVAMVADATKKARPGEWILGRGWHQEKWERPPAPSVEGFPIHEALSRVSPDNPVLLTHASGHATIANAKALALAGITPETPDPPGGQILRDSTGRPTGLLRENASGLVSKALDEARAQRTPEQVEADALKEIDLATSECLSKGITSFQDAGSSFETIDRFKRLAAQGKLGLRLWVMIREDNEKIAEDRGGHRLIGFGGKRLTVRAIKRWMDGALGSRGAWLLEPYSDLPATTGLNTITIEELRETARLAAEGDYQLCVHAIGDRANREVLNAYEQTFRSHPGHTDWRWRIEHAQHLAAEDIPRFGKLGVIASMQGIHCTSDAPFVVARLGAKRAEVGAYAWRKLLDSGAEVVNGTDAPVEDVSPIACFYASVTRRLKDGSYFYPEQKMTRLEALKSYTSSGAYAAFEEDIKGSLSPGKLADITVLSQDILTVPDDEIMQTKVDYTIVGGRVAYSRIGKPGP